MNLKLKNTLHNSQKENFKPLHDGKVRLYSCGPTVYDNIHIGNLSAFITADTLRRVLGVAGYEVRHVMNFTDVDDKTIKRSSEEFPSLARKEALKKLTKKYTDVFLRDMRQIGNDIDNMEFITATESIEGMRRLITELYEDGFAYIADDGVYFSIDKYKASGKTYGQLLKITASSTSAERINNDEYDKDQVHDFALWKTRTADEPSWTFELAGKDVSGRPGWHIECSVMSTAKLGQPFDIHTGGVDLIFPHHENEIAQSTAGKGDVYAKYFIHNEHLLVEGKKMSKSLKNFFTLDDIISDGTDPLAFRLLVLMSHYRSKTNFTKKSLQQASTVLANLRAWADLRFQSLSSEKLAKHYTKTKQAAVNHLMNDMDTPEFFATIIPFTKIHEDIGIDSKTIADAAQFIDTVCGLDLTVSTDISKEVKFLLKERLQAKQSTNYDVADEIRDKLKDLGVLVKDTPQGQIWERLN